MKKLLLLVGLITLPTFASVSANVSFASDYIWRGMTNQMRLLYKVDLIIQQKMAFMLESGVLMLISTMVQVVS